MSTTKRPSDAVPPSTPGPPPGPSGRARRVLASSPALGALVALLSWNVSFSPPSPGLDPSWWAALYLAPEHGLDHGTDLVFTYGPLGFLAAPWLWNDLATVSFLYGTALDLALAASLVWTLRRAFGTPVAVLLAWLVLVCAGAAAEEGIVLAAIWCVAAMRGDAPAYAATVVAWGGATLGAVETLVSLRSGPVILLMCGVTLLAHERRRRELPRFAALAAAVFVVAWLGAGQSLRALPEHARTAVEVVSGHSEAMGLTAASGFRLPVVVAVSLALLAAAWRLAPHGRPRAAMVAVVAIAVFLLYKEAVVRADAGHADVFFATVVVIGAALAHRPARVLAAVVIVGLCAVRVADLVRDGDARALSPVAHLDDARAQARLLLDGEHRQLTRFYYTVSMSQRYALPPETVALLRGRSVHVAPWEVAVTWLHDLEWAPLPVFQDYLAYTTELDELNAERLRTGGPDRILRRNPPDEPRGFDGRLPAWDPPLQSMAMFCRYRPLHTTPRWQVLARSADRCGRPRLVRTVTAAAGTPVRLPAAAPGSVVFARVRGVEVSGLERVRALVYRARERHAVVNGSARHRLVPGTASSGLILDVARGLDLPTPFALGPGARSLAITGVDGEVRLDVYAMPVQPWRRGQVPDR